MMQPRLWRGKPRPFWEWFDPESPYVRAGQLILIALFIVALTFVNK